MSRGLVLILACCASLFSFSVQASPMLLYRCKKGRLISPWCAAFVA